MLIVYIPMRNYSAATEPLTSFSLYPLPAHTGLHVWPVDGFAVGGLPEPYLSYTLSHHEQDDNRVLVPCWISFVDVGVSSSFRLNGRMPSIWNMQHLIIPV